MLYKVLIVYYPPFSANYFTSSTHRANARRKETDSLLGLWRGGSAKPCSFGVSDADLISIFSLNILYVRMSTP